MALTYPGPAVARIKPWHTPDGNIPCLAVMTSRSTVYVAGDDLYDIRDVLDEAIREHEAGDAE